jgi:DNA-binding FrmR family transcriptional regulator
MKRATTAASGARGRTADAAVASGHHHEGHADVSIVCAHDDDGSGRKAVGVDADAKERNRKRLRRIEGQVRGLQKMVEEDRYCADVLTQISSVHEALRAVGRELMRNHLKHCVTAASNAGGDEASVVYDELVDMMYKHSR